MRVVSEDVPEIIDRCQGTEISTGLPGNPKEPKIRCVAWWDSVGPGSHPQFVPDQVITILLWTWVSHL